MIRGNIFRQSTLAAAAFAAAALPALAQEPAAEPPAPNTGKLSISGGVDFTTTYFFRGIPQENQGFITQPYGTLTFKLYEGEEALNGLSFFVGTWNSMHSGGPTGPNGTIIRSNDTWYESDLYAGFTANLFDNFAFTTPYTAYTSPNNSFDTIQEIALTVGFNDADVLGAAALSPYFTVAYELQNQADPGNSKFAPGNAGLFDEGTYAEVGIKPSFMLMEETDLPITIAFPIKAGFSLGSYYEDATGGDEGFGFAQAGVTASAPITLIPSDYGAWTLTAGFHYVLLGSNAERIGEAGGITNNESFFIGTVGIGFTY